MWFKKEKKEMTVEFLTIKGRGFLPLYAHKGDAGIDFKSPCAVTIEPKKYKEIDLALEWEVKNVPKRKTLTMAIRGRSGLAFKHYVFVPQTGTVDQEYKGSIKVMLYNGGEFPYTVKKGEKVCQGIITLIEDLNKNKNKRKGGFGSSGK